MHKRSMPARLSSKGVLGIAVLVMVILGVGAWYLLRPTCDDRAGTALGTKDEARINSSNEVQDTPTTDPPADGQYLVIKEWGVRFLLPKELQGDVSYGVETSVKDNSQTARFEVGKISQLPGSDACKLHETDVPDMTGKRGGVGAFIKRTSQKLPDDITGNFYAPNISIGEYWYSGGREKYSEQCIKDQSYWQEVGDIGLSLTYQLNKLEQVRN